jgi:CDP-glucose 4,6-dehydratase
MSEHETGEKSAQFWSNRRVLLTGHTGFKGAWMSLWLRDLGAQVTGFSLAAATKPNLWSMVNEGAESIIGDIRDVSGVREVITAVDPQVVIHMAAQALVGESYRDPLGTYSTNVMGTANLLQACRSLRRLQAVVVVTSDKVYENRELGHPFQEQDRLGGRDPYSVSKACTEFVTAGFRDSFYRDGPPIATARAGNVIGGGDWSPDRLIPDCVRALDQGVPVALRYPDAVRPWQHVLEPIWGYLSLAEALVKSPAKTPSAVNFGPDPQSFCTVHEVVEVFSQCFDGKPGWTHAAGPRVQEATNLTLSSSLAQAALNWHARLTLAEALSWTADWYRAHRAGDDMAKFSRAQILRYRELINRSS